MYTQAVLLSVLVAIAEARFGQEQLPIAAISALGAFGNSGQAATLAGQSISFLLGAANPCGKLSQADLIVTQLGTDPAVIAAARGLVAAEQNFNPFAVSIPAICDDATLPKTEALRGVVPLVDPAVTGSAAENANSKTSLTTPFDAAGLSVAEVMAAQGFANFTAKAADGSAGAAPVAGNGNAGAAPVATSAAVSSAVAVQTSACVAATSFVTVTRGATATAAPAPPAAPATGNGAGAGAGAGGADFGTCKPTIDFQLGRPGRKATEGTFLPTDAAVAKGQQDALNPNIITNRVCDQLTNVCGANAAAKALCLKAKATVAALGTKDATTATAFNSALGF